MGDVKATPGPITFIDAIMKPPLWKNPAIYTAVTLISISIILISYGLSYKSNKNHKNKPKKGVKITILVFLILGILSISATFILVSYHYKPYAGFLTVLGITLSRILSHFTEKRPKAEETGLAMWAFLTIIYIVTAVPVYNKILM